MTARAGDRGSRERIIRYGPHDDQWIELTLPSSPPRGVAVLVHGGYWRSAFTSQLMHPLVPSFTARGWVVANIEYRRGPDGWAATRDDLALALTCVRATGPEWDVAIIGHSVGGQLALLAGREADAIIALAPVTDVIRGYHEWIGDGAVAEFFRDPPGLNPDLYSAASPLAQVPPRGDVLIVHGQDDARVPLAHTRDYIAAARAAGGDVDSLQPPRLSHLDAIDPAAFHWVDVHAWLDQRMPRSGT